ncbi:MAG: N-acetylmuramoyl-L-alanine amidase [Deltaproteobacteria bacterium]|nr:N-acetylmuramoyl-L-alanine amidase [Deltaproteobacteria bacterium]
MKFKRAKQLQKVLAAVGTATMVACVPAGEGKFSGKLATQGAEVEESSGLALVFDEAAEAWRVPVDVLKAMAYAETRLVPAQGEVEFDEQPQPWGIFAIRGEELVLATQLAGYTAEEIKTDVEANIHAAAALMSYYADEAGLDPALRPEPMVWGEAIGMYGKLDTEFQATYAENVLRYVRTGLAVPTPDGETLLIGRHGQDAEGTSSAAIRAPGTVWKSSPNFNSRGGKSPRFVVIHTCEGAYSGCVSWLRNSASGVSAHYVVNDTGSEISQLVEEENRAWHIGAAYRSRLNGGQMTDIEGASSNTYSVGIEHAGRASQPSWDERMIEASADLVAGITDRHNIPKDRYHVVAHGTLQPENRVDPGPNWPWTHYLDLVRGGAVTPPPPTPTPTPTPPPTTPTTSVTVDNETQGRFRASSAWDVSSWSSGRIGSNYRFRRPQQKSDPAEWRVPVPETGNWEIFARVPGYGYNNKAPFLIYNRGQTTVVWRNLGQFGGEWMSLGTFALDAGDDWLVGLSCWTNGTGYLIADAVRIERR